PVLASRTITVPLVRSADPRRAKINPMDHDVWPCDRQQLVDDLWAVGLAHLPELKQFDAKAARKVSLMGRDLEPWRAILAVALWLEERHAGKGLFGRIEKLMLQYQIERGDFEAADATRLLLKALLVLTATCQGTNPILVSPGDLAKVMNDLARADDLVE